MRDHPRYLLITLCLSLVFIQVLLPPESHARTDSLSEWCRVSLDSINPPDVVCDDCCFTGVFDSVSPKLTAAIGSETRWAVDHTEPRSSGWLYARPDIRGPPLP